MREAIRRSHRSGLMREAIRRSHRSGLMREAIRRSHRSQHNLKISKSQNLKSHLSRAYEARGGPQMPAEVIRGKHKQLSEPLPY